MNTPVNLSSVDLAFASAADLTKLIVEKKISAVELCEYYIERIEQHDKPINAIVVRDFAAAINTAQKADADMVKNKKIGAFHGLPITVKESFDVKGLPTTWGDPEHTQNIASSDAVAVSRIQEAGAIVMGKSNIPLNVSDFQSYNEVYGQTNNPWNLERTPGGSSGGAAAAVAAGLTAMEIGSDLGGSVRGPAHFCGVYAHKPTWGIIPFRSQQFPGAPSVPQELDMAVPGPIARDPQDLALALHHLAGADSLSNVGWQLQLPAPGKNSLKDFKVAIWPAEAQAPVEHEISDRVVQLGNKLSLAGAQVSDTARPDFDLQEVWSTYRSIVMALTGGPGMSVDYQQWLALHLQRGQIRQHWQNFFKEWDILICPISSTTAFEHDHSAPMSRTLNINGEARSYWEHVFWAGLASLAYLPATVFPTGQSLQGLPIGLQAIGGEFQDYTTIEFARLWGREFGGFQAPEMFAH